MSSFTYLTYLLFESDTIEEDVRKRCQTQLKKGKAERLNNWSLALYRDQMSRDYGDRVEVKRVSPLVGEGVFTLQSIPALAYIGEYTGIVRKKVRKKDLFNNYIFRYQIGPKEAPYIIDAENRGNFTRFLNHSDTPNLTSRWIIYDGVTHIIFYSNRLIHQGEQLTYDYGPLYWRSRSQPVSL